MKKILLCFLLLEAVAAQAQNYAPLTRVTAVVDGYPMLSPDGQTILFESDRTGNSELYTMRLDGSGLKQLTFNQVHDDSPVWSPDGRLIAFTSRLEDPEGDVYLMNADGSNLKRLTTTPGDDSHPKFSPDGQQLIFNSARNTPDLSVSWGKQHIDIYMMNTDGTGVKRLTDLKTVATYPSISPDGSKILFRRVIDRPGLNWDLTVSERNSEVYVMNLNGTGERNLSGSTAYDGWPAWTPDGRVIFASNRGGIPSRSQLYLVNADGSGLKQISDPLYSFNQHSVSADGKKILVEYNAESMAGIGIMDFIE